jgi:hypothetical protein
MKLNEECLKELENPNKMKIEEKINKEKTQSVYKDVFEDQIKTKGTPMPRIYGNNFNILNNEEYKLSTLTKSVPAIKPCKI